MAWKITLPSGSEHTAATVTAGQFVAVSEVLDGARWDQVEPLAGPRQLTAWIAILMAAEDDGDLPSALTAVLAMPMQQVIAMLNVDEE